MALRDRWTFLAPQRQAMRGERLLDLFDRLLAEVRDGGELVLGLRHEVADRLDPDALEAVVRTNAELELLDGVVLHPVRESRLRLRLRSRACLAEALPPLGVGEDRELAHENLGRLADRLAWVDRAVGGDLDAQLVVVRPLADASRLD